MTGLKSLLGLLLLAPPPASKTTDRPEAPARAPMPQGTKVAPAAPALTEGTACGACHVVGGWKVVKFDHDKTGFPLRGAHQRTGCRGCHADKFEAPVPRGCMGCHPDRHRGDLGTHCEGCHDEESWRARYAPEAHRRTNFPLFGRHAVVPCEECHAPAADRTFSRAAVPCVGCHQRQYDGTVGSGVDHARLVFSNECQQCHDGWRFSPARFPGHDACYLISAGPHAGIACRGCHSGFPAAAAPGSCATGTAGCTTCHEHACSRMDGVHAEKRVAGYQCKDRKCYECHRLAEGAP